ncbi:MAG: cob(I)yrinic acid a,c-diamide adenosyltransferase [Candidatus Kerfeldbacteria bacterium CG08_land_8_20_14_0_20_43_14]|uniref:Cob(I)yrinic acid a,c-diamide adenosyltransferase n=1 Tax=Candidatus Kerfeldbacteria bacterium CG08_land_8_20_14_0_20_43_14 TaxID=2014246 RepID=A0A2H0YS68_9BACT|nr:MAG: cob(I)yrinic acid a,c-diamide adenosyltransferase [Candidatus Kerfeldbacteria bacterium CG08_land_8_20_14_0_20_43_14]
MNPKKIPKLKVFPRGLNICYFGKGKGKTTAAVGLAVRAAGYGLKVLFFQFFKSPDWPSGERLALERLGVKVEIHGKGFVGIWGDKKFFAEHKKSALEAFGLVKRLLASGKFQVVILDEIISCLEVGLLSEKSVGDLLKQKTKSPKMKKIHLVMTGHKKYPAIARYCDLITEMKMVKHPFYKGFLAVKGIDY